MKKVKFAAIAMAALAFVACKPNQGEVDPPIKSTVPEVEATDGAYTIVWNAVDYSECNGLVFAGNYNGYKQDDVAAMAQFEKIEGYTNWYKAVVVPTTEITQLEGKPNALASDGTFPSNWDHQWIGSEEKPCELIKGPGEFAVEYSTETKLIVGEIGAVTYVRSYGFKVDPCVEEPSYEVTFNVEVKQPMGEKDIVYVVGDFVENAWTPAAYPMTRVDAQHFTAKVTAKIGREYKYVANAEAIVAAVDEEGNPLKDKDGKDSTFVAGWYYDMAQTPAEGKDCSEKCANSQISDIEVNDVVYGFFNLNAVLCEAEVVEGVMYIKCAGNGWAPAQMTMVDANTYTYETTIADVKNIGANVGPTEDNLTWYPLDNNDGLAEGDAVVYTFTVDPAALVVAKK